MNSTIMGQLAMNEIRPIIRLAQNDAENRRFDFPFPITQDSDIRLAINHQLIEPDEYQVYGLHNPDGGYIECQTPPALTSEIVIWRKLAGKRQEVFIENGEIRAASLNAALDRLTMLQQDFNLFLETRLGVSISLHQEGDNLTLPQPQSRRALMWDEAAKNLVNSKYDPDLLFVRAKTIFDESQDALKKANEATQIVTKAVNEATSLALKAESYSLKGKPSFYGFKLEDSNLTLHFGDTHYVTEDFGTSLINIGGIQFSLSDQGHLVANLME